MMVLNVNASGVYETTVYGNGIEAFDTSTVCSGGVQSPPVTGFSPNQKMALGSNNIDQFELGAEFSIDEIAFWDRELTAAEIMDLYTAYRSTS